MPNLSWNMGQVSEAIVKRPLQWIEGPTFRLLYTNQLQDFSGGVHHTLTFKNSV